MKIPYAIHSIVSFIQFAKPASLKRQLFSFPVSGRESCKVLTFKKFADEIQKCDHSNESYWVVLPCCTVYYAVQGGSNFWVFGMKP